MTTTELPAHLDGASIDLAAAYASGALREHGVAHVHIAPGDSTCYKVIVIGPTEYLGSDGDVYTSKEHIVALTNCAGVAYPWNGHAGVHPSYAAKSWTSDGCAPTGVVIAAFLNALAGYLADR